MNFRGIWSGVAVGVVVCAQAFAQEPNPAAKRPGKGDVVVATGCLSGPTLQSTETTTTDETGRVSASLTYQLKGNKKLLSQMREEHDGNIVSVTGVLKSVLPQDGAVREKTMGKTKVTFGIGTPSAQKGVPGTHDALPVLEVKSYEGTGSRCGR